jgi:hypothetical protein
VLFAAGWVVETLGPIAPRWLGPTRFTVVGVCAAAGLFWLVTAWVWLYSKTSHLLFYVPLSLFGLLGLVDLWRTRLGLLPDSLVIRRLWSSREVPRDQIRKVSWERGSGVSLQLTDESWVKLPELGWASDKLRDEINAWLKATA